VVALVRKDLGRHITVWGRLGLWYYSNRQTVGTGPDEIEGNTKTEITVQVRVKF